MGLLSELRYPTRWYTQLISAALALIFFALLSTATLSGFLLYRMVSPARSRADINLRDFPGRPEVVPFTIPGVGQREGWFFPGLKTAPTIILCHGYQSQRGELLTLVSALQDNQYNVFLFDFAGHGSSPGLSTFGYREVEELHGAIAAVARRSDVDRTRFGLWGANLGAYAVVGVAAVDSRVGAFVVDSVYERPEDMVRLRVQRSGLGALPLMKRAAVFNFRLLNYSYRHEPPLSARLSRLRGVPKLFMLANDEPQLAESTRELFLHAPEPREQILLPTGNYAGMLDDQRRVYENRVVSFFLLHLSPSGPPRH